MTVSPDHASDIAIAGLQYIANDPEELGRFLSLTGINPEDIRTIAGTPQFMTAVLDYFLGNEPTLLAFTAQAGIQPSKIQQARHALVPPSQDEYT